MKYSNGFDLDEILPVLRGRVGFYSDTATVRNIESFHPLATSDNLKDSQPDESISDVDYTTFRTTFKDEVIQKCLLSVFNRPEYIEQVLLHQRIPGSVNQSITGSGQFCGIRLNIAPDFGIGVWIKTVTLLFDGVDTFNLYLFKDGTPAPIETISVTTEANTPTVIDIEDLLLHYDGATTYYLGYFQDDLTVNAIREQVIYKPSRCFAGVSFQSDKTDTERFDQTQVSYTHDAFGLNAEIHSFRDFTNKIKRSAHLFDEIIGLSMAYAICKQIIYSTRSNRKERIMKDQMDKMGLQYELDGAIPVSDVVKTGGLQSRINKEVEKIQEAFYPKFKSQVVNAYN